MVAAGPSESSQDRACRSWGWISKAPMSTVPSKMRMKPSPRWSSSSGRLSASKGGRLAKVLLPASMAGLPGTRAWVAVGPPLSARAARMVPLTPTWLALMPSINPPALAASLIRLLLLPGSSSTKDGSSVAMSPLVLPAMMVLWTRVLPTGALLLASRPPVEVDAVFSAMVDWVM